MAAIVVNNLVYNPACTALATLDGHHKSCCTLQTGSDTLGLVVVIITSWGWQLGDGLLLSSPNHRPESRSALQGLQVCDCTRLLVAQMSGSPEQVGWPREVIVMCTLLWLGCFLFSSLDCRVGLFYWCWVCDWRDTQIKGMLVHSAETRSEIPPNAWSPQVEICRWLWQGCSRIVCGL